MKRMTAISCLSILMACGGGGSTPDIKPTHVPGISNFRYTSASSAVQGSGGGAATVNWRFHVVDAAANASNSLSATWTITAPAGKVPDSQPESEWTPPNCITVNAR